MNVVLSHLTGNPNVKAAANGFAEADLLSSFYVSLATFPGGILDKMASIPGFSEVRRRNFDDILKPYIQYWPWREIGRIILPKLGLTKFTNRENAAFYIDTVCKNLDSHVATKLKRHAVNGANAVYCYEDVAEFSFHEAKKQGLVCLYDLPIGYWRTAHRLLEDEKRRWPDWISTITGFNDSSTKLQRKDHELSMADHIFVASTFTANTLKDFPSQLAPVHVIPYGFPPVNKESRDYYNKNTNRPLRLLFVGSLSQRKGIADLFAAVKDFGNHVALTVVGGKTGGHCNALNEELQKHRWIPTLSHSEVLKLMREHDVFIFPSLFEGFGLVITEAMSQGTPVITTERTAGPDLIKHGENGWIVRAGSTDALRSSIENILTNKHLVQSNSRAAAYAAGLRPWNIYGKEIAEKVRNIVRK